MAIVFKSDKARIEENKKEKTLTLYKTSRANYDGIIGDYTNETKINYKTGLLQSWTSRDYYATYIKRLADRKAALDYLKLQ